MRYAVEDYTFSDGTTVPAGYFDCQRTLRPCLLFKTLSNSVDFGFIKMKDRAVLDGHPDKKLRCRHSQFEAFGQDRHACSLPPPVARTRHANYDVKLENGSGRSPDFVGG